MAMNLQPLIAALQQVKDSGPGVARDKQPVFIKEGGFWKAKVGDKVITTCKRLYFAPLVGAFNAIKAEIKRFEREHA